uniref:Protein O-mannosyl-transferase C-terminal four TM domain-containing protein n=1 Tax=Ciona savignyi TaxID=51511 RepID=H2Z085_CIOSA
MIVESDQATTHQFSSSMLGWPLAQSNIAYWYNRSQKAQIHFIGNVWSWVGGLHSLVYLAVYSLFISVGRQRKVFFGDHWDKISSTFFLLSTLWFTHVMQLCTCPYKYGFIYQYLPAVVLLHILQAVVLETLLLHCGRAAYIAGSL